jgi:hypothetical protein
MTQSTDGAPTRCDILRAACVEAPSAALRPPASPRSLSG